MQVQSVNNLSFGHNVHIDSKIIKSATKDELNIINTIRRNLQSNRINKDLKFEAIVDSANNIVNVTHVEEATSFPKLYRQNQSFKMDDFLGFLKKQEQWHEERYLMDRQLEAGFGAG